MMHLLIVEDDPDVAESLREALIRDGYQVHWESTGQGGLTYVRDHNPHLVVLDVRLPDMSGFDVCSALRRMKLRLPILMLTARREEADKVVGLEVGADDYVTKPFGLSELRSRIRALLRRSYGELAGMDNGDVLYARDLMIDRGRGLVSRAGQPLHLTPTEFRLLIILVQHNGQVLSRTQLLDLVWGWTPDVESEKTVNVHIRRLREKIEPDPANPTMILTVPGMGYRFGG
jgi:DNA-binding response OmpR family regulator